MKPAERNRLLTLATRASVGTAVLLIAAKLVAYLVTDAASVLASLVDSLMDASASLLILLAVRYAMLPPDREHRFGHGKAEGIAALAQATFITGSGLFLLLEAGSRLLRPRPLEDVGIGIAVMLLSMLATVLLLTLQHHVIRRTGANAIRADALHYRADLLTNAVTVAALLLAQYGWTGADPLFALGIGIYILSAAWAVGRRALDELLDRELPDPQREQILAAATAVEGVLGVHDLRTRLAGQTPFIQLHLELRGSLPLSEAHAISDRVVAALKQLHAGADIVIHQDPEERYRGADATPLRG